MASGARILSVGGDDAAFLTVPPWPLLRIERHDISTLFPPLHSVGGDPVSLEFPAGAFSMVLCLDTLERVHPAHLQSLCAELSRVARDRVLVSTPYRQNLDVGRTTCANCHSINPPYGHVGSFDELRLRRLFAPLQVESEEFYGTYRWTTNPVSCALLNYAGNPYGTYSQTEPCTVCGARLKAPGARRSFSQRLATRIATTLNGAQTHFTAVHAKFIHMVFKKNSSAERR